MRNMSKLNIALLCSTILVFAGCHKLLGGGWFYGLGGEKVTFGFNAQCYEDEEKPFSLISRWLFGTEDNFN